MVKEFTHRQLKVSELIKNVISNLFIERKHCHLHPDLSNIKSIIVSEVQVSSNLKSAFIYVTPLDSTDKILYITYLNEISAKIRHLINPKLSLKFSPSLIFKHDKSFDDAMQIKNILTSEKFIESVSKPDESSEYEPA